MKAVILVGGEGTRLRPLTLSRPKPMAPIGNIPFLEHMLSHLRRHGLTDVVLAMGYLPGPIQEHFGDGSSHNVNLTYEIESKPLGTAGAARNALRHLDDTCFVFNGDVFTTIDLGQILEAHRRRQADVTITLTPVDDPSRFGVVVTDESNRVLRFIEKPPKEEAPTNLINAGIYVLEPRVLEMVPEDEFYMFENGVFPRLLEQNAAFYAEAPDGYWIDIGTPAKYLEVNRDYAAGLIDSGVPRNLGNPDELERQIIIGARASFGRDADLQGPAVIGDDVWIGESARVVRSVIGDGVRIGPGALVRDSILASGVVVGAGSTIDGESVIGRGALVGAGSRLVSSKIWPSLQVPPGSAMSDACMTAQEAQA